MEPDLEFLERFVREPGLIGPDWADFRPVARIRRQCEKDEFLGPDDGRLIVEADGEAAGFVSWQSRLYAGVAGCWEIGIVLLPKWRGKGMGWRAQDQLCSYCSSTPRWNGSRQGHSRTTQTATWRRTRAGNELRAPTPVAAAKLTNGRIVAALRRARRKRRPCRHLGVRYPTPDLEIITSFTGLG